MRVIFLFSSFILILLNQGAMASTSCRAVLESIAGSRYALEIGQHLDIELVVNGRQEASRVTFLGISKHIDGTNSGAFFFNAEKLRIEFVGMEQVAFFDRAHPDRPLEVEKLAPIVRSVNQQGGTCAAYAIFNCFRQLYENGHLGNGMLAHHMADEPARNRFFVRINNDYYADGDHRGVEVDVAREVGLQSGRLDTSSPRNLADHIRKMSELGWPMIIYFSVDSNMSRTPYSIYNHLTGAEADRRLWQPRQPSNSSTGGHEILLVKAFVDTQGKEWLLVVDSNWQAPRLWDIQQLNNLNSGRIGGWAIWQSGPNPPVLPPPPMTPFFMAPPLTEPEEF